MNYLSIYNSLIAKRKTNILSDDIYGELHHIIPRCQGGDDSPENLIRLTAKEHYVAHHLLYKHYRTSSLAHAWFSMLRCSSNQKRFFTAKQHEISKKALIKTLKATMKGENNPFYGKTHSEETKKILSEKMKKWYEEHDVPQERIANWIDKVAKKPASDKQKTAVSASNKGKITIKNINTGECIKVDKSKEKLYDETVWKNPAAISQKQGTCIHCGVTSNMGNIKRWHNDNCKKK